MAVGAYFSAFLTYFYFTTYADKYPGAQHALFVVALLAGGALAAVAGYLVGLPSLRLRGDYLAIVTLGFGEIIRVLILNIEKIGGARGFSGISHWSNFFWVYFFAGLTIVISWRLVRSSVGRAFLAVREDQIAAEAMGVNTTKYKVKAFVIGSFWAGVAGGLFAHYQMYLNPTAFTFLRSFELVVMAVLGGLGSISGSIIAAVVLTILPELLRMAKEVIHTDKDPRMGIYSITLIVLMLTRPQGLLGRRELWQVLPKRKDAAPKKGRDDAAAGGARRHDPLRRPHRGHRFQSGHRAARARRPDRPERRREDDDLQHADRRLRADRGRDPLRRKADDRLQALRDHRARRGPHVPEHPPVQGPDSARQREDRRTYPLQVLRHFRRAAHEPLPSRRGRGGGARAVAAAHLRPRAARGGLREEPAVRRPAPPRDRARAGRAAEAAAARRAGRGTQRQRDARPHGDDPRRARPLRHRHSPHRAQHGACDGDLRAHSRAELRQDHRARNAGGSARRSGRGRGLPRRAGGGGVSALLSVSDLEVSYGAIAALHGISLDVEQGEIVTLIGANGAGKTTTLRTISGLLKPRRGAVSYQGRNITGVKPHAITAMGVSHVPEGRGIFANLSVSDNLELGAYLRKDKVSPKEYERIFTLFPVLKERIKQNAGTLSGGEQQMLAISRALMSKPQVLLLDEPSLGLAPQLVQAIFGVIREINAEGTTILLVEQNAHMALMTAHRGYVMETGRIVLQDTTKALLASDRIKKAYLGG